MAFSFSIKFSIKSVVLVAGLLTVAMLFMGKGHVFADCAITGGNDHDYAGAVITTQYWDYGTNTWVPASGSTMRVKVTTDEPIDSPPGNVVQVTASQIAAQQDQVQQRQYSEQFKVLTGLPTAGNCPNDGVAAVITGDGSSGSPANDGGSNWALDCDISKHPTFYQSFEVTGTGYPTGATPGGTWTVVTIAPHNGYSATATIRYTPPERSPKGNIMAISCTRLDVDAWDPDDGRHGDGNGGQAVYVRITYGNGGPVILGPTLADAGPMSGVTNDGYTDYAGWTSAWASWINTHSSTVTIYEQAKDLETGDWKNVDSQSYNGANCQGPPLITVNGSCTTMALTGAAWDTDDFSATGPAFLTVSISYEGGFVANVVANQPEADGHTHGYTQDVSSLYPGGVGDHTFTLVAKGVNGSGTADGKNTTVTFHLACSPGGGGGTGCPSLPNPNVAVTLTDQSPSTSAPGSATTTAGASYEQDTRQNKTNVTAVNDISTGGNRVPPALESQSYQQAILDYSIYVTDYPYDSNQASVTYDSYYNRTMWYSSSSPDYYNCSYPSSHNQASSTCSYGASSYYFCGNGGYNYFGGSTCYVYQGPGTYNASTNTFTCTTGSYYSSLGGCYTTYTTSILIYYCPGPGGLSGTTCYYGGTAYYNWHQGATTNDLTKSNTVSAQLMSPCWDRSFNVTSVSNGSVNFTPDPESPTGVSGGGVSASVDFEYYPGEPAPALGLRLPMQVNLSYSARYTWAQASGATVPYGPCFGTSGPFNVTGGYSNGTVSGGLPSSSCSASIPPLNVGDQICMTYTVTPTGTYMNVGGTVTQSNFQSLTSQQVCSSPVTNVPYDRFYGNDVKAGAQFPGATCDTAAAIMAERRGSGGSGSQFAAMSIAQIQNFSSAFLRSAAPTAPTGLSFANTTGGDGGNLGGGCNQLRDFFDADIPGNVQTVPNPSAAAPLWGTHTYSATSGGQFNGGVIGQGGPPNTTDSIAIFVDGDVYISNNVIYSTSGWSWDPTTRNLNVPSFYLIVKGDIDIDPGVTQLDGIYIAQGNDGKGGTIRTCSQPPSGGAWDQNSLFVQCDRPLHVNGAFIAGDVRMDRSFSSLRDSVQGENPFTIPAFGPHFCDVTSVNLRDCSAELFMGGPEIYLGTPALKPISGQDKYDSVTSLPPVL